MSVRDVFGRGVFGTTTYGLMDGLMWYWLRVKRPGAQKEELAQQALLRSWKAWERLARRPGYNRRIAALPEDARAAKEAVRAMRNFLSHHVTDASLLKMNEALARLPIGVRPQTRLTASTLGRYLAAAPATDPKRRPRIEWFVMQLVYAAGRVVFSPKHESGKSRSRPPES